MHFGLESFVPLTLWLTELACFLLSVFWRPTAGLYLLVTVLPLQTIRYKVHGYFLGEQFVDLLLLGVILGVMRQKRPVFSRSPLTALLIVQVVFTYLSLVRGSFFLNADLPLWFSDPRVADWKNYIVATVVIYVASYAAIETPRQMRILILLMGLSCLLLAKGYHNTIGDRDFSSFSYSLRDPGPMGYAGENGLAAFCAQWGVFFTAMFLSERRFLLRMTYVGAASACLYCLIYSLSRGGYVAFLMGILFLGFVKSKKLLLLLVVFLVAWQSLVPTAVQERIMMTEENGQIDSSAAHRLSLWEEAVEVFQDSPAIGLGFNTYAYGTHHGGYGDTHNVFVKVLVESGLLGLSLFLALFYAMFALGRRLYKEQVSDFFNSIGLGFSALMVSAFFGNLFGDRWMFVQITGYTFVLAAIAARCWQLHADGEVTESEEEEELVPADDAAAVA